MTHINTPLRKSMCNTCPFKEGSKYEFLKDDLQKSSTTKSRICHSTGSDNAINKRTGFKPYICRGARNFQLKYIHTIGIIDAPTDESWNEKRLEIGMPLTIIEDPIKKVH